MTTIAALLIFLTLSATHPNPARSWPWFLFTAAGVFCVALGLLLTVVGAAPVVINTVPA